MATRNPLATDNRQQAPDPATDNRQLATDLAIDPAADNRQQATDHSLHFIIQQFLYYKMLGEKSMAQIPDEALFWQYNPKSNSIAMIVSHISGNMLSRFTDFLTSDGEKPWRNRDKEFEPLISTRAELMVQWNRGWDCLMNSLNSLQEDDLGSIVYIRNDGHTVIEAINRQLAHYPYHIGQIVYIAKMAANEKWESLSIPRNKSSDYNSKKFAGEKAKRHFTKDLMDQDDQNAAE